MPFSRITQSFGPAYLPNTDVVLPKLYADHEKPLVHLEGVS